MKQPIYMDCHATTPVDPRVAEVMRACLEEDFGNPSSVHHAFGLRAGRSVWEARALVA